MNELIKELGKYVDIEEESVKRDVFEISDVSILEVRDELYKIAHINSVDEEQKIIVLSFKKRKYSSVVFVAIKVLDNRIEMIGYAKEGMINQNMVGNAFEHIKESIKGDKKQKHPQNKKIKYWLFGICILIVLISVVSIILEKKDKDIYKEKINKIIEATNIYNEAVERYNTIANEYNNKYELGYFQEKPIPNHINEIDIVDNSEDNAKIALESGNSETKILKDVDSINELIDNNKALITILEAYITPDEKKVFDLLDEISEIKDKDYVGSDNGYDLMISGKVGYYSCIYFSVDGVDQENVPGNNIVEKGVDAGGAIELYECVEDAKNRCEYLSQFDGSILTSGSYTLVGTMVIRLSYQLGVDEQRELTEKIINAFEK